MELKLVVEVRGSGEREVALDVQPTHLVSELRAALGAHLEVRDVGGLDVYNRRTGVWLDPDDELRATGLRSGDRVALADRSRPLATDGRPSEEGALVDLLVTGGPSAGRRVPLAPGEHRVGSFRYSGIMLDDPTLARIHLVVSISPFAGVVIEDPGSEQGTYLEGRRISEPTQVEHGQVVSAGQTLLTFVPHRPPSRTAGGELDGSGRIAFNRPPRVARPMPGGVFKIDKPPTRESGGRLPMSAALVPLGMGVAMALAFRSPFMLIFAAFSPIMVLGSVYETKIFGGRALRKGTAEFRERLEQVDRDMAAACAGRLAYFRSTAPDAATLMQRARTLDPQLWERRPGSADWLLLRVGWADRPSEVTLEIGDGGEQPLREEAQAVAARHARLVAAPMLVSLQEVGVLGISGDQRPVDSLARYLGVQLAVLHSPEDLALAAAVPPSERDEWAWLGWLPHVHGDSSPLTGPLVVADRISARALLDRMLALVVERQELAKSFHGASGDRLGSSVVAFLHEDVELPRGAVSTLLERGPKVGVHAIWLSGSGRALPGECGAVVHLEGPSAAPVLTFPATGETVRGGGADGASSETALEAALALAPVRDVSSREASAGIPRRVNLMELLGLQDDPEGRILDYWIRDRSNPEERLLSATWGMAAAGEPFSVSLRQDGPHALVGGMTGSGKSELLQSLVASLAAAHSPRSLNFLLVDYKGGAAFKDCIDLPHTVGFVTDLDGHLVNRALISLRAELRRREEILREAGAKDLLDLEAKAPDRTPASLLIVVDEFAALAAELPEFVDGMVDVAQRGRSLGIHLLLATQRPQGVINDKIRANMNLRVSLRFSDEGESQDVVGTRDAARPGLPPGRAFARTGPGEVTEFQAGYVGGHTVASTGPSPVTVRDLGFGGDVLAGVQRRGAARQEGETDLLRLVGAINEVNRRLALPPQPRPWLPTLPEVLPLETLPVARPTRGITGLLDDPAGQRQIVVDFGLGDEGSMLVFGTSGSGKTTLLRSLAVSVALSTPPTDLHVYGLDFATRGLKPLEALPHCGGVIAGDELERTMRLLRMLRTESERRKGLLASTSAATLSEYLAGDPPEHLPYILVLLDGFTGFVSTFENIEVGVHIDTLRTLVAEGRPVGIAFVISVDRLAGTVTSISASVARRTILRMATDDDYSYIGLPRSVYHDAHLPPGRGFTDKGMEVQIPIVGPDPAGSAQAATLSQLGADLRRRYGAVEVPQIKLLPKDVGRSSLPPAQSPMEAVVGLEDRGLQPVRIDLDEGHFVVAGPRRSGRTTALATFALSLAAAPDPVPLHLLAPRQRTPLAQLGVWASTALGTDACVERAGKIAEEGRSRPPGSSCAGILVIDDGEDLADGSVMDLDWIAQRGREQGLRILVGVETQAAQRAFAGWLTQVLRERQGVLLDPDPAIDGTLIGAPQLPRRTGGPWPPGRGYLVRRGVVDLVQLAL